MDGCLLYAVVVLVVTSVWVYIGRDWSFPFLAKAMFFPTLITILFVEDYFRFTITASGVYELRLALFWSCVAVLLVFIIVYGCVALDLALSWATKVKTSGNASGVHEHNSVFIWGFLRAAGEEIGWRCFMLPCLLSIYSPTVALSISGVVWGLFHIPVMILLTTMLSVPKPYLTILVQSLSCLLMAYPIGWLTIKSKFSLWACTVMHAVWNQINPKVLGSIYTHQPGEYTGEQWKINGEGLAGCIVILPVALLCLYDLEYQLI